MSYVCSKIFVMNTRHWWNGRWSRLARRDIFVRPLDGRWLVELRRGGPAGRSHTWPFGSERDAVAWVESALVDAEAGWREPVKSPDALATAKVASADARAG